MSLCFFPDNTVLVNFGYLNRLRLLGVMIPDRRWCEVVAQECADSAKVPGLANLRHARDVFGEPLTPTERERDRTFELRDQMRKPGDAATKHVGEAETIAIVTSRDIKAVFITDDKGARSAAEAAGITVITTWDLLKIAYRKDLITLADAYADAQTLESLDRGWPPCGKSLTDFTTWLTGA